MKEAHRPTTTPVNPRKKFPWTVEFEGLEPALVQQVTIPGLSVEVAEHGSSNILVKTGGMVKVGDIELKKLMFMDKPYDVPEILRRGRDFPCALPRSGDFLGHPTFGWVTGLGRERAA